jgi:hypothetical protein
MSELPEVGAAKTMIDRTEKRFGLKPERLAADRLSGSSELAGKGEGCRTTSSDRLIWATPRSRR